MSIVPTGVPPQVASLMQNGTLERVFHDALVSRFLFRAEAIPEIWPANLGDQQSFTRRGLLARVRRAIKPGSDPTPSVYQFEKWKAQAEQLCDTLDSNMATSYVTLASLHLSNLHALGIGSADSMNGRARDRLYRAYCEGEAMVDVAAASGALTLHVETLSGFSERLFNGDIAAVSAQNPMPITFASPSTEAANTVVGVIPDDSTNPAGPGLLQLGAALGAIVAVRVCVLAKTRAKRLRVGGATSVDGLTANNIVTVSDVISAVARLRGMSVPPHADGLYHVHVNSAVEAQLYRDNHWQRLHQSLPDSVAYRDLALGQLVGCAFFRNELTPSVEALKDATKAVAGSSLATIAEDIGCELTNDAGLPINRTLVTGGGSLYEKYIDESKYISDAGVMGKIGEFSIINGGVAIMTKRVRLILRAPIDRLQQISSASWSWSGDFPVPSDQLSGDDARYKRCVAIESA